MYVINAHGVNDAYFVGMRLLVTEGRRSSSRAGEVLVMDRPVTTVYSDSCRRVLFDPKRDAHPGFHLFEALWMLAGRNDARFLDLFVKDFSSRFAEDDGIQHGAYGFRWRQHFDVEGGGRGGVLPDQLETVIRLLTANPGDRQAVIAMWDPVADLDVVKRDRPCNTHIYLRLRGVPVPAGDWYSDGNEVGQYYLDMTVCCRSNDAVWGAYGANAVHFSVLQEYLAAYLGVAIGKYYQISNNFHVYADILPKLEISTSVVTPTDPYLVHGVSPARIVAEPASFDRELRALFEALDKGFIRAEDYRNPFLPKVAYPVYRAFKLWREGEFVPAYHMARRILRGSDWQYVTLAWMQRRLDKKGIKP